jgi:hypothetical protein
MKASPFVLTLEFRVEIYIGAPTIRRPYYTRVSFSERLFRGLFVRRVRDEFVDIAPVYDW